MTVDATPSGDSAQSTQERKPPPRRNRASKRIAVLYNVDFEDTGPENDPAWASRAEVESVAKAVAAALSDGAYETHLVPVDGDLASLRARVAELDPTCAFNLCESLGGDARLESAVPLVLELLGVPFTGSPPEVLSFALRKDRVKQRLEAAGIPTPAGRVLARPDDPCDLPFPLIAKPVREDGSVGIHHWRAWCVELRPAARGRGRSRAGRSSGSPAWSSSSSTGASSTWLSSATRRRGSSR